MASTVVKKLPKRNSIFMVNHVDSAILGSKLPSRQQVLRYMLYRVRELKETVRESASETVGEVMTFWEKARIPTQDRRNIVPKVEALYHEWRALQKNTARQNEKQVRLESEFRGKLDDLFDIASADAMDLIMIEQDKEFLRNQRMKGRVGCIAQTKDEVLYQKEVRINERKRKEQKRLERYFQEKEKKAADDADVTDGDASTDEITDSDAETSDIEDQIKLEGEVEELEKRKGKRAKINIMTPKLLAALDTTKISARSATKVVAASVEACNLNLADVNVNTTTLHRARTRLRADKAQQLKSYFKNSLDVDTPLIVHWDGKMMKDAQDGPGSSRSVLKDRLPVLVTGHKIQEQLLGSPALTRGTGKEQAIAVSALLSEWQLTDNVQGMCTDTTSSNTGRVKGACVLLEGLIGRDLIYFACRHHMLELVLKAVFQSLVASSSGPDILLFKRFRDHWPKIDQSKITTGLQDNLAAPRLQGKTDDILIYVGNKLKEEHGRDDYREFLELVTIYLHGIPARGIKFSPPGALHEARWMAKALYALKIMIFKEQFRLTAHEEAGLREVCIFVALLYVKAWFSAPNAVAAPYQDLILLRNLCVYEEINKRVSVAARETFCRHTWYLGEELAAMALFDPSVPIQMKRNMLAAMSSDERNMETSGRRPIVRPKDLPSWASKNLEEFVSKESRKLFTRFNLPTGFLDTDPAEWDSNDDYKLAKDFFSDLCVVNDVAERGVALTQEYVHRVKNEKQLQNLLLVSQNHRKMYKDCKKETLSKPY